jgi:hypothetical protein
MSHCRRMFFFFPSPINQRKMSTNEQTKKIRFGKKFTEILVCFFLHRNGGLPHFLFQWKYSCVKTDVQKSTVFNNNNNWRWWQQQERAAIIREQHQVSQGHRFTPHFFPDRWFWRLFSGLDVDGPERHDKQKNRQIKKKKQKQNKTKTTAWISHIAKCESKIFTNFVPLFLEKK